MVAGERTENLLLCLQMRNSRGETANATVLRCPPLPPRTALCVDRHMPPSAEVLAEAVLEWRPTLQQRRHFAEGPLASVQPHASCVLASVHANIGHNCRVIS